MLEKYQVCKRFFMYIQNNFCFVLSERIQWLTIVGLITGIIAGINAGIIAGTNYWPCRLVLWNRKKNRCA